MTSKQQSITSMISVVAEGRCALLATYQIFQFIVGYAMAQAFATNLMYTHALQMGNYQYLIGVSICGSHEVVAVSTCTGHVVVDLAVQLFRGLYMQHHCGTSVVGCRTCSTPPFWQR
jgi:hypothetical protein